jgi:DNA invertase Pin-like site-specific DNA recombinase
MGSTESPLKRKVTIIPPTLRFITHVAIYCRVSSDSKEKLNSLINQISFLTQYVYQNAQWRLMDIYIDIQSGRDTASRSEFERMMNDYVMNKIEKIVSKSISRFGRNTVDTLDAINMLRTLGVDVYFQNENLNSLSGDNSFLINLIEAIAQEESAHTARTSAGGS